MAAGRWAIGLGGAVAVLLGWALFGGVAGYAQAVAEIRPLERGAEGQVDRYLVTLLPGGALWDVASTFLPLTGLDEGEPKAYQLVLDSFQRAFPGRQPGALQPGDSFPLEVPAGTFVTEKVAREGNTIVYHSFQGDQLTSYSRHPAISYRLIRRDSPDKAEVSLTGQGTSAVDLAREIYQVDPPDFIQVRMVRAALQDRAARVIVDLNRKYLDDFRNYRERALSVKDGDDGRKVYTFAPEDQENPFVQVEDAIGDQNDPATFPRLFRLAYYRDGTIRGYVVTESGDTLTMFNRPDPVRWQKILPTVSDWEVGTAEPLPPFAPAVNQTGSLITGRLLVVKFSPRGAQPAGTPGARAPGARPGAGLTCLGVPLGLVFLGLGGWGVERRLRRMKDEG